MRPRSASPWPRSDASQDDASQFVTAAGIVWHVQRSGHGPAALLLHGTGASTHSWADLAPLLAHHFSVVAVDLPGHGLSGALPQARMSLPGVASAVAELLRQIGIGPAIGIGHSAGAAVLARMTLDHSIKPRALVSLNGALLPLHGWAGQFFSPLAKLLALNPIVPHLFAWRAGKAAAVERLIAATGSRLSPVQTAHYGRLIRDPKHVTGALAMLAHWDLQPLADDLSHLPAELLLVVAQGDRTLPPAHAKRIEAILPRAKRAEIPRLGHLAHEEDPHTVSSLIVEFARENGVLSPDDRATGQSSSIGSDG
ncbi:MAG: alpha/beta fold hydrolase BchO [Burkholderiaceae bacterium]